MASRAPCPRTSPADVLRPWFRRSGFRLQVAGARRGVLGLTYVHQHRVVLYVRPGQARLEQTRVLVHELGHVLDLTGGSTAQRHRWSRLRGLGRTSWWPKGGTGESRTGAGDFAEAFVAAHLPDVRPRLPLAGPLTAGQRDELLRLSPTGLRAALRRLSSDTGCSPAPATAAP